MPKRFALPLALHPHGRSEVWVYTGREERQEWFVPGASGGANGGANGGNGDDEDEGEEDDSGGTLWLPGNCAVTFRAVPPAGAAANGSSNGAATQAPRGFAVGLTWLIADGTALSVEREYDAAGRLCEVRCGSGVKGGWTGGRM